MLRLVSWCLGGEKSLTPRALLLLRLPHGGGVLLAADRGDLVLDLAVDVRREDLLAQQLVLGAVGAVLDDGVGPGLADARQAGPLGWILAALWPFGARQTAGASAETATTLNKMMVAFFIAILIAIASMAVYSNLTFVPPVRTQ